jgi:hypothetical protein
VATEDVVYLFQGLSAHTGIDLKELAHYGRWISQTLIAAMHPELVVPIHAKRKTKASGEAW